MSVHVCVRAYEREVTGPVEVIGLELKSYLSWCLWTWGQPTDMAGHGPAVTKVSCFKKWQGRIRLITVRLHSITCMAAWRMRKGDILESMLPISAFQKEAILF